MAASWRSTALSCHSFRKRRRVARTPVDGGKGTLTFAHRPIASDHAQINVGIDCRNGLSRELHKACTDRHGFRISRIGRW